MARDELEALSARPTNRDYDPSDAAAFLHTSATMLQLWIRTILSTTSPSECFSTIRNVTAAAHRMKSEAERYNLYDVIHHTHVIYDKLTAPKTITSMQCGLLVRIYDNEVLMAEAAQYEREMTQQTRMLYRLLVSQRQLITKLHRSIKTINLQLCSIRLDNTQRLIFVVTRDLGYKAGDRIEILPERLGNNQENSGTIVEVRYFSEAIRPERVVDMIRKTES